MLSTGRTQQCCAKFLKNPKTNERETNKKKKKNRSRARLERKLPHPLPPLPRQKWMLCSSVTLWHFVLKSFWQRLLKGRVGSLPLSALVPHSNEYAKLASWLHTHAHTDAHTCRGVWSSSIWRTSLFNCHLKPSVWAIPIKTIQLWGELTSQVRRHFRSFPP